MKELADIRKEYSKASFDVVTADPNPLSQFEKWFDEASKAGVAEPTAMHLATISESGRPSARIVLLKGIEGGQFVFFTNYQSKKGKELDTNPACAITFFWPELERQIRIEGIASRISVQASEAYFQSRPRGSQVGAWASPQSLIIKDRAILEERVKDIESRFKGKEVLPKPHQWGGYAIDPFELEFWQGRPDRLHDRILYSKVDNLWKINRLAP